MTPSTVRYVRITPWRAVSHVNGQWKSCMLCNHAGDNEWGLYNRRTRIAMLDHTYSDQAYLYMIIDLDKRQLDKWRMLRHV